MPIGDPLANRCGTVALTFLVLVSATATAAYGQAVEWTGTVNVSVDGTTLHQCSHFAMRNRAPPVAQLGSAPIKALSRTWPTG